MNIRQFYYVESNIEEEDNSYIQFILSIPPLINQAVLRRFSIQYIPRQNVRYIPLGILSRVISPKWSMPIADAHSERVVYDTIINAIEKLYGISISLLLRAQTIERITQGRSDCMVANCKQSD